MKKVLIGFSTRKGETPVDMDMVKAPLMLKASNIEGGIKMAQEYGKEVAQKITESDKKNKKSK